jgi:TonB-linked SusC/RagA family outer membrane protein
MTPFLARLAAVLCLTWVAAAPAAAQTGTIKGRIIDDQTGAALPSANVFLEKTSFSAASDERGDYALPKVPVGTYVIVASLIGYQQARQTVTVVSDEAIIVNLRLKPSDLALNPVVVTAIGTQEQRERMGVTVSTVEGQAIARSGGHDVLTNIAALAPGVFTTETTGDPGMATRIVLRGVRSLQNRNQPLILLDGVPMISSAFAGDIDGVPALSRMVDLNPEYIQSIELYKGPSAASLWGSQAANGVISIKSRTGGIVAGKRLGVSVRFTSYFDELLKEFPLQRTFGQGVDGSYVWNSSASWGDRIATRSGGPDSLARTNYPYAQILQKNSTQTYDHATELYRTPYTSDFGATVRGGDEWGDFFLDFSQLLQRGIILTNSDLKRYSVSGNATRRFAENLDARFSANFVNTSSSRIQQGSNISGLLLGGYRTPPDFNNDPYLVDYVSEDGAVTQDVQRTYRNGEADPAMGPGYNNPLFTINNVPTDFIADRLFGMGDLTYSPVAWLSFTGRLGADYYTERRSTTFPPGDASVPTGQLTRNVISELQVNGDLYGRATQHVNDWLEGSILLGLHYDHRKSDFTNVAATRFVLLDAPPTFENALDYAPTEGQTIVRTAAMYGEVGLNLYNQVFLRAAGRGESASTYGPDAEQTYFYPSVSAAWQFSQLEPLQENEFLTFGKLRAAYGVAANQPPPYVTSTYFYNAALINGWGPGLNAIYFDGGALRSAQLGNSSLRPEMTKEFEFGVDLRFWMDRIWLSATQYFSTTSDAIVSVDVAPSSGFYSKIVNAVEIENVGTELQFIAEWLRIEPFSWSTTINWATNRNEVTDLAGVKSVFLAGFNDPSSSAILNQPVGVLYGTKWDRHPDGSLILDAYGFPQMAADPGVIGDPNPRWRMGLINTFRYENLTLSVLFDFKQGGQVWNGTKGATYYFGTHGDQQWWTTLTAQQASTLINYDGETPDQSIAGGSTKFTRNADGTVSFRGYIHDFGGGPVVVDESYYRNGPGSGFTGPAETFIEDASFIRLREVSLSYLLPLPALGLQSLTVRLSGRNLALWSDYTGTDPETNLTGPTNGQGLDYFNNPSVRSWILSLQLDY